MPPGFLALFGATRTLPHRFGVLAGPARLLRPAQRCDHFPCVLVARAEQRHNRCGSFIGISAFAGPIRQYVLDALENIEPHGAGAHLAEESRAQETLRNVVLIPNKGCEARSWRRGDVFKPVM